MKNRTISFLFSVFFCQFTLAQGVYGVFTPLPNNGEKQIGTISPATGAIGLLGSNTSVETGSLTMTTGATALNVANNKSYFVAQDALNVDRVYTVDLTTGVTDTNPALTINYTTSNNWGVWYDEPNAVLYALFSNVNGSGTIEMASINTTTGTVTQIHSDVTGNGASGLGSGLMTGDSDNNRVFTLVNGELFVIATDASDTAHFFEVANEVNASLDTSSVFGLEWHKDTGTMWFLYNEDNVNGDRQLMEVMGDDNFNDGDEVFQNANILLDNGDAILTGSGLAALDVQSSVFFFIGRPSSGPNSGLFSLYSVDLNTQSSTNAEIQDPLVQTNGYAGIEVLPGPELSFSKTDGGITTTVPSDTITYTLDYSNAAGAGATSGLKITETVPAETTFLPGSSTAGWACLPNNNAGATCELSPAEIGPGGSGSATFVIQVDDYVTATLTQVSNNATLSATNAISDALAADTTPITAAAVLAVTKTDSDLIDAIPGDTIAYNITADNTGDRIASNVVLTETVPTNTAYIPTVPFDWTCLPNNNAGSTCTTTAVDVGAVGITTTFHAQIISSVPAGTTEISNTVTMSADNATSDIAADTTPVTSAAVLSVNKSDGGTSLSPGSTVVYQIDYGNTGDQDADTTTLSEVVLTETVFNPTASDAAWVCLPDNTEGSTCTIGLGTLGGSLSGSADFALTLNTPVPGIFSQIENTVTMDASNASAVIAQDVTPIDASVDLRIVKTDGDVTAALGKVINYTLINFNDGDRDALSAIISETVPDNTTFYPPSSTTGWACVPDNSAGSNCTFSVGSLAGLGGKSSIFFAVKVDSSLDPGVTELSNTATLSAFNSIGTDSDTELTPVDQIIPSVTLIDANPSITEIASCSQNDELISAVVVSFLDDNPGLIGVDDSMNYLLIDTGIDQDLQTMTCDLLEGDDVAININTFVAGGTTTSPNATLTLDEPLAAGQYVLMVCDDITDAAGNAIDGNMDGFPGGNLKRQFRVEFDNLVNNANLDDCTDNPISLNNYNIIGTAPKIIAADTTVDIDDSALSGSVYISSPSGIQVGIEQCINFESAGSHTISASGLGKASQSSELELILICAFIENADCLGGTTGPNQSEEFILPASTTPQWQGYQSILLLPANTSSAFCAAFIDSAIDDAYEINLDAFSMIESDLIFKNGFESD